MTRVTERFWRPRDKTVKSSPLRAKGEDEKIAILCHEAPRPRDPGVNCSPPLSVVLLLAILFSFGHIILRLVLSFVTSVPLYSSLG